MSYDLFSPAFKADPFPTFARMRRDDPVYARGEDDGRRIWYLTRYADVAAALKDERFVKDVRNARDATRRTGARRTTPALDRNMLFSDPPDHTRLRRLVSRAFTPGRVAALAGRVQEMADRLLDAVAADGGTDLIAAYAEPLPVEVISELLGVPEADRPRFHDSSRVIIAPSTHGIPLVERKRRIRSFVRDLRGLFAARQATPRDDLVTALVQAEETGDRLSTEELTSMVALLFVTGHETVVHLIGNGTLALLRHPDQLSLLRDDEASWDDAVEELLRFDGPVETSTRRWAREDLELHGHAVRRGDLVRPVITSANRDGDVFVDPDVLDVRRQGPRHLAFGVGPHYCLGAPLARLQGRIAVETLVRRFPRLRLARPASSLRWRQGVVFRGLKSLPVAWD